MSRKVTRVLQLNIQDSLGNHFKTKFNSRKIQLLIHYFPKNFVIKNFREGEINKILLKIHIASQLYSMIN